MSIFLSRWCLHMVWITLTCSLILEIALAQNSCNGGTTILRADSHLRYLSFPSDGSKYPPNCVRKWLIVASQGSLELSILQIDIEESGGCIYDALTIIYGNENPRKLCGRKTFQNNVINTGATSVMLNFSSDAGIQGTGFEISFRDGEGINLIAEDSDQYLTYPASGNYPNDADIQWRIDSSMDGQTVRLSFLELDIEYESHCDYDSLTIYDGYDSNAPLLEKRCGKLKTFEQTFISRSRYLFLHFVSDGGVVATGFKIAYRLEKEGCNSNPHHVIELYASDVPSILTSPNFPAFYPSDCQILWRITSSRGRVKFTLDALDLEDDPECRYDSLTLYDGYDDHSSILQKLCGFPKHNYRTFVSSSPYVYVSFISDSHREGGGFQISFTAEDPPSGPNPEGNSSRVALVGGIIGGICSLLFIIGIVGFFVRRTQRQQRRQQRSQQHPVDMSPANPATTNSSVYMVSPSAPPPPYASLNQAYIHEEPPPSYSEANLYTIPVSAPPLYSNAVFSNGTAGSTSPATLSGVDYVMAALKEQDDHHIYMNESGPGANSQSQETSLSRIQVPGQEPYRVSEDPSHHEHHPNDMGQEHHQDS